MEILEGNIVRHCRNCGEPLSSDASYCPKCSQKYTDGKVPIWQLFRDLIESFLNLDSKIFRTLGTLFIPGKLTIEYFKGKHVTYIPPVRIFLIMAIFHFAMLSFMGGDAFDLNLFGNAEQVRKDAYQAVFMDQLDTVKIKVQNQFPNNARVAEALDSLTVQFKDHRRDSLEFGYFDFKSDFTIDPRELQISQKDAFDLPFEVLTQKYGIQGYWEELQVSQALRLLKEGKSFASFLFGKLIWMVILMMPALALVLKLLYIRRQKYFVEHLVFSFHYHAFAFFIVGIAFLLEGKILDEGAPISIGFTAVLIYLFIAMRRVYQQHWFKTFIKYTILNFSYIIIFTLFFGLTLVASVLLF
ncbi:MAG: DUF3667 domain-containing protein [Saprospiraceae bacterium]